MDDGGGATRCSYWLELELGIHWNLRIVDTIGSPPPACPLERGCPFSEVILYRVCTNGVSFVGRFVLFWSILYRRFHCKGLKLEVFDPKDERLCKRRKASLSKGTRSPALSLFFFPCTSRLLNRKVDEWGDSVTVISCDMRDWESPEKVWPLVSYLEALYVCVSMHRLIFL